MIVSAVLTPIVPDFVGNGSCVSSSNKRADRWLADEDIPSADARGFLHTYTTPRSGFGGQLCWPIDEVSADE